MSTKEFDYQAFMANTPDLGEIHRGPKARKQRRAVTEGKLRKKNQPIEVLEIIQEIVGISTTGDYIYRGEPEHYSKVSSSLYRQYREMDVNKIDFETVQHEIIKEAKRYTSETEEIQILALLQHFGGATNLIDFTTDYLIALFFACDSSNSWRKEGRVILWNVQNKGAERFIFPRNPENRVIAQKSVFVQSTPWIY